MKRIFLVIFLISLFTDSLRSQNVNACNAAQPVCQNPNFQFTSSAGSGLVTGLNISNPNTNPQTGNGNNPLGPSNSGCLFSQGPGPQWLLLTVSSTGTLGFSFGSSASANPQAGFYDWAMWPYTPTTCSSIFANTLPPVSCNWNASSTGGTGMGPPPVGGNVGNYQPALSVTVGQQFLILISNYSGVTTPVSFSNTGSAGLSCNPFVIAPKTICKGSSAVLSGTTTLTNVSATITPGGNVSVGSAINFTMSPTTTTSYTITLTGTDPQNAVVTSTTSTSITVLDPTVAINSASTVCEGGSVNLTASATGTAVTYSWNGPGGYTSATQNPVLTNLLPPSSGIYTVQANVATGTLVCSTTNTTDITVIPVAQVTVAPSVVSICQDLAFTLSSGAPNASGYLWNGPMGYTNVAQNPGFTGVSTNMTGIYTVTAFFTQNNVVCSTTNTVDVTVKPKVPFTLAQLPNICDNTTLVIPGPFGATSYTWTGPGGYTSNTQNLSIPNVNTNQSGVYTLVTDVNGCTTSDSISVTVLSPVTFSIVPGNRTICQGDTVHMNTSVVGGSGVYNIVWTPNNGLMPPFGTHSIASPTNSTFYTITANDVACPTQFINTTFIIFVNPLPQPNISASKIEGCVPLCIDMQSNSSPQAVTVGWDFGGGLKTSGDPINFCFNKAGTYSVTTTIVDINGCKSTRTAPFVITAFPRPGPDFSWDPNEVSYIMNFVNFYSTSASGSIVSQYWDFGDMVNNLATNSSTLPNPTHEYSAIGNYPVTIVQTNVWGCTDTLIKVLEVIEDFTMYIPNAFTPNADGVNDIFQPKGMGWLPEKYEFLIYDRWGTLIFKTNDYTKGWDGTIKGSICPSDVYVYKIKATSAAHSQRKEFAGHVTLMK